MIELEPKFSIAGIPGKCLKCAARGRLESYLRKLLRGEKNKELMSEYEGLLAFLSSPELRKSRDETEKLLSEGNKVKVRVYAEGKKPRYYELEWISDKTRSIRKGIITETSFTVKGK
jgi:hypothetical protein